MTIVCNDDGPYTCVKNETLLVPAPELFVNDSGFPEDTGWFTEVYVNPIHGFVFFFHDGGFRYETEPGYVGTVTFWYRVWYGSNSDTAIVTINVVDTIHPMFDQTNAFKSEALPS